MDKKFFIKGVNLGNWLVLEKWMSPAVFEGTTAADEYYLPRQLSREVYESRIHMHRREYISERDFAIIKGYGLNAVRIPVPYFLFGDCPPFIGCLEELDNAFNWAGKYGLKILIDLHTVPGSQNGFDNGGISGVCKWAQNPEHVSFTLNVLEKLAKRYGNRAELLGIQPLNEPLTEKAWEKFNVMERYQAADPEMAKGSGPVPMAFLKEFYKEAYMRIRKYMPDEKLFVIHDGFDFRAWNGFMSEDKYQNVVLDTHLYLMNAESEGCEQTVEGYVNYVETHFAKDIAEMENSMPVICGEWSLFNSYGCGIDTHGGLSPVTGLEAGGEALSQEQKKELYSTLSRVQLQAWEKGSGYFFWTYKMLLDTVNDPVWNGWDSWDFGKGAAQGWFPEIGTRVSRAAEYECPLYERSQEEKQMKYTVISLFIPFRSKRKIGLVDTYRIVKNAGFEYIDVDNILSGELSPEEIHEEIEEGLRETGLKPSSYLAFLKFPVYGETENREVAKAFRDEIDFCEKIGCSLLMATPCGYQQEVEKHGREAMARQLSETLKEVASYAETKGIRVGIEDAPDLVLPMCSQAEVGRLLRDNQKLGFFFDTGNMYPMQEDPVKYYEAFRERICHVHIKDLRYTSEKDEYQGDLLTNGRRIDGTTVGEGMVPLEKLIGEMKKDGYDGFLSLEYTPTKNDFTVEEYGAELKKNFENLKRIAGDNV